MPEWTEHVIWWHVYPLGFVGADTTGRDRDAAPRLRAIEPWLDHLVELGANGLALGPIFASSTHGYDTVDYFAIDERLGDHGDFDSLIAAAHARGIRVMLDGVFNHVGRGFAPLARALADPEAEENALFRHDGGELATFEGHDALVALDHSNPAVADYVVSVMTDWLDRGADGWRLDAAYSVPTEFWAAVLPRVREKHPDAYFLGEVLHGDYADFVRASQLDSVTQYELWQAIWHSLQEANLFELDWALKRHNEFLESFVPYTFVGNHDVTRIASQIDDERHHPHALVLLLTLGGTPSIYYGDELGYRAVKEERFGGDDDIRPRYPDRPAELGDDSEQALALHRLLIGLRRRHPWLHSAVSEQLSLTNTQYCCRVSSGDDSLVVALNIGDDAMTVTVADTRLLAGEADARGDGFTVAAHGWAILGFQ